MLGAYWAMMGAGMYKTESIDQDGALLLLNMLIQLQQLLSPRHKDYRGANSYSMAMVAFSSRIILKWASFLVIIFLNKNEI